MATEPPAPASPALPRGSLVAICLPTAALLGYGAAVLPWARMTPFALVTGALAALHGAVTICALARLPALRRVLRALGIASLLYLVWIAAQVAGSGLYVAEIYGSLGKGVAAGLGAAVGLVALLTLPLGLWALALTRPSGKPRSLWAWLIGGVALFCAASGAGWAQARTPRLPTPEDWEAELRTALDGVRAELPGSPRARSLFTRTAVRCPAAPGPAHATLVLTHLDRSGRARSTCLQGDAPELPGRAARQLRDHASRGPVKVDWLSAAQPLQPHVGVLGPLVDVLALRPGLDGACHGQLCLMPWQLVAGGMFAAREPTPYIPKMRLGFAIQPVRGALDADSDANGATASIAGLVRIETQSLLFDEQGTAHPLRRLRPRHVSVDAAAVAIAERAAEAHALSAQHDDGTFRYELDAYRGRATEKNPSIPRHAGTTLVLCELGLETPRIDDAIRRALQATASYARRWDDQAALTFKPGQRTAMLGSSALGLVALTGCRGRAGAAHDRLIGELARFLLAMQRPGGDFRPGVDLTMHRKLDGPTPMFAGGQAIMALVQLEGIVASLPEAERTALPSRDTLREAVQRAMDHVAGEYWPRPLRDFLFLKENWHCLAARAALPHHRHDGYERFCIDYVEFKSRLLLRSGDDVAPEFVGGYGFGNVVPPHNGSSAGLGEALGAAIALREARGLDTTEQRARMRDVLEFLLRQQAKSETCFACNAPDAAGWFSGYMVAPTGRIDHIQHPWSAIGHGARALGLGASS